MAEGEAEVVLRHLEPSPFLELRRVGSVFAQVDVTWAEDAVRVVLIQVEREEELLGRGRQRAALELDGAAGA
jgi:hypothetical protein